MVHSLISMKEIHKGNGKKFDRRKRARKERRRGGALNEGEREQETEKGLLEKKEKMSELNRQRRKVRGGKVLSGS